MPYKHITQREARETQRKLYVAETKLRNWTTYQQPGVHIGAEHISSQNFDRMRTARKLGFGLLIVPRAADEADIYAVRA